MSGKARSRDWQATDPHLRQNPIFLDFVERLGEPVIVCDGLMSGLWRFAFCFAQDGDVGKFTPSQLARAVGWEGDPDLMWDALTGSQFIEHGTHLHDWGEWGGRLFAKRTTDAQQRWDRRNAAEQAKMSADKTGQRRTMGRERGREREREKETEDQEPSVANKSATTTKVSAPKVDEWADRASDLLEQSSRPSDLMQLAELMASENKTGRVSLSRVVRELYAPLVEMQSEFPEEAMRYGLRAAITSSAPNANYVRKAAAKYRPGADRVRGNGGGLTVQEILGCPPRQDGEAQ
jgi:chemotaxis protein histidine kinase CheA